PDVLSEALWPDSSAGAESRLHLHIHRLRARLGTGTIESGPDGYRLDAPHDTVDVWRFERAVGDVLAAHFRGRADTELLRRLEDAVQLWVGAPFPGVEHPDVTAERYRLEEMYLLAQEAWFAHLPDRGGRALVQRAAAAGFADVAEPVAATAAATASKVGHRVDAPLALHRAGSAALPVRLAGPPALSQPRGLAEALPVGLQGGAPPWE